MSKITESAIEKFTIELLEKSGSQLVICGEEKTE